MKINTCNTARSPFTLLRARFARANGNFFSGAGGSLCRTLPGEALRRLRVARDAEGLVVFQAALAAPSHLRGENRHRNKNGAAGWDFKAHARSAG